MFGFGSGQSSASHNHSAALQKMQADVAAHKKSQVPLEMSNAFQRFTSFYGRGVAPADGQTTINNYVKTFSDAKSWAVEGFYNPSKFEQTKSLRDFVACAACGQEYKLLYRGQVARPQEIVSLHESQKPPICDRTTIAAHSEEQINAQLPGSRTNSGSHMPRSQPPLSQSLAPYPGYSSQSGSGRQY